MVLASINWGNALIITFMGIGIVFIVLVFLIFIISLFGKLMAPKVSVKKATNKDQSGANQNVIEETIVEHIPALDSAAIATALHLYFDDVHDEESHIITIKSVERRYSPWNSKIYGLNNNLIRR